MATAATEQVAEPQVPPWDEWRGILWMNTPQSPWRKDSEHALKLLSKAGFVVIAIETSGIGGPQYSIHGTTYRGLREIRNLAAHARRALASHNQ